jgi:hypothetical protein
VARSASTESANDLSERQTVFRKKTFWLDVGHNFVSSLLRTFLSSSDFADLLKLEASSE